MAEWVPTVRRSNWLLAVPQLVVLALVCAGACWVIDDAGDAFMVGAVTYLAVSWLLRAVLLKDHYAGMRALRESEWGVAVGRFRRAEELLAARPWIDRYRALTVMSHSAMSYREMALLNLGFAHIQGGDATAGRAAYEHALAEYPDSVMARTALHTMEMGRAAAEVEASSADSGANVASE